MTHSGNLLMWLFIETRLVSSLFQHLALRRPAAEYNLLLYCHAVLFHRADKLAQKVRFGQKQRLCAASLTSEIKKVQLGGSCRTKTSVLRQVNIHFVLTEMFPTFDFGVTSRSGC